MGEKNQQMTLITVAYKSRTIFLSSNVLQMQTQYFVQRHVQRLGLGLDLWSKVDSVQLILLSLPV